MTKPAPIRGGIGNLAVRVAVRVAAVALVVLAVLAPAATALAEGPQPDPCSFLAAYGDVTRLEIPDVATQCEASFPVPGIQSLVFLEVRQFHDAYAVGSARVDVQDVDPEWLFPTTEYGQIGYEGTSTFDSHIIEFAWYNYVGHIGTSARPTAIDAAKAAARSLNAAMQAGIGPPASASASPGPTGAGGTASPGASSGTLAVGIGCAEDGVKLRCTSSVDGAEAANLTYEWTIDGLVQSSTEGTLEVDIVAARIPEGDHVIVVKATDRTNGKFGTRGQTMHTSVKVFAVTAPTCTYGESSGTFEIRCRTSVVNAPPNPDIVFDWNVDGQVFVGTESISRTVGQGLVLVAVNARDRASGQQTAAGTAQVVVNPVGVITNILTGGQTSDPANVIDEVTGSALGAAALGAGVAIAGALGAMGSVAGGAAGAAGAGAAGAGAAGAGAGPAGPGGPGAGAGASGTGAADPTPAVEDAVGDLLGAEAGNLPPPTPANAEAWKTLVGWPPGPEAAATFDATMGAAVASGLSDQELLNQLREEARAAWAGYAP